MPNHPLPDQQEKLSVGEVEELRRIADNIERSLPGGSTNTYSGAFGIRATTADAIRRALSAAERGEDLEAALKAIASVGDGRARTHGRVPATTGEGHARCLEIARQALGDRP